MVWIWASCLTSEFSHFLKGNNKSTCLEELGCDSINQICTVSGKYISINHIHAKKPLLVQIQKYLSEVCLNLSLHINIFIFSGFIKDVPLVKL